MQMYHEGIDLSGMTIEEEKQYIVNLIVGIIVLACAFSIIVFLSTLFIK